MSHKLIEPTSVQQDVSITPKLEVLIHEGVFLTGEIQRLQEKLRQVKEQVDQFFPAERTSEQIINPFGTVTRTVRNKWCLYDDKIDEVRKLLGENFPECIKIKTEYQPNSKYRKLVLDADNPTGKLLKQFTYVDQGVSISFRPVGRDGLVSPESGNGNGNGEDQE